MARFISIATTNAEKTSWRMNNILVPGNMVTITAMVSAIKLNNMRELIRAQGYTPPSYTTLVIKAAALTMKKHPEANRAILGPPFFKKLYQFKNTDICVAVEKALPALPGQAYAAVISDPIVKKLAVINQEMKDLVNCTEENNSKFKTFMTILKYVPSPLSNWLINMPYWHPYLWIKYRGCAAWVNSPSKAGADFVITTWPWPLTFSFGKVEKRALVIGDKVEAALTIPLLISFDRRIMGGGPASRLFSTFKNILESASVELFD